MEWKHLELKQGNRYPPSQLHQPTQPWRSTAWPSAVRLLSYPPLFVFPYGWLIFHAASMHIPQFLSTSFHGHLGWLNNLAIVNCTTTFQSLGFLTRETSNMMSIPAKINAIVVESTCRHLKKRKPENSGRNNPPTSGWFIHFLGTWLRYLKKVFWGVGDGCEQDSGRGAHLDSRSGPARLCKCQPLSYFQYSWLRSLPLIASLPTNCSSGSSPPLISSLLINCSSGKPS